MLRLSVSLGFLAEQIFYLTSVEKPLTWQPGVRALAGSATAEGSKGFSPSRLLFISDFVAILRKQYVLLFRCFKVHVFLSLCAQADAEIRGINRCYLKRLIYGQLNNMPISSDLIGNQGTFFLSAVKFYYIFFPVNSCQIT